MSVCVRACVRHVTNMLYKIKIIRLLRSTHLSALVHLLILFNNMNYNIYIVDLYIAYFRYVSNEK